MKQKAPKVAENMEFIKAKISQYEESHQDVHQDEAFDEAKYNAVVVSMYECQEEMRATSCKFDIHILERIDETRELLKEALEAAKKARAGTKESAMAWETVEELEAAISHLKAQCQE